VQPPDEVSKVVACMEMMETGMGEECPLVRGFDGGYEALAVMQGERGMRFHVIRGDYTLEGASLRTLHSGTVDMLLGACVPRSREFTPHSLLSYLARAHGDGRALQ